MQGLNISRQNSSIFDNYYKMEEEVPINGLYYEQNSFPVIILIDEDNNQQYEIQNEFEKNKDDFKTLLEKLELYEHPLNGMMIFYYDFNLAIYVYCGNFPNLNIIDVPQSAFNIHSIMIKYRCPQYQTINQLNLKQEKSEEYMNMNIVNSSSHQQKFKNNMIQQKRTKERIILDVLQNVAMWRQYYEGFIDENGNLVKISLEDSANKLDISKKTLDDYLLQIRLATKYNFDFFSNLNQKMGVLRAFVKKQRDLENQINKQSINSKLRCHFKEIDLNLQQFLPFYFNINQVSSN